MDDKPYLKKPRNYLPLWLCLLAAVLFGIVKDLDISFETLLWGVQDMGEYFSRYGRPDFHEAATYLRLMGQTVATALWGTLLAFVISFLGSPLAAKNLSPHPAVYHLAREVFSFMRAMPDLLLALMFVSALGLGPLPGALALGIHTAGFLGKFLSESMERVDGGVYEAMSACGAGFSQTVMFAAWPSITRETVGYTLYIFDRNVRMASVLGLVGAGGIGLALHDTLRLFQYDKAAALMLIILITIIAIDWLSGWLRRNLR